MKDSVSGVSVGQASQAPYLPQFVQLDVGLQLAKTNLGLKNKQDRKKQMYHQLLCFQILERKAFAKFGTALFRLRLRSGCQPS